MLRIDLHCHTTASDGLLQPSELVARAREAAVNVVAVTDHDTVAGVEEAIGSGVANGVRVVAGIEISARHAGRNVHMLGYFLDFRSARLDDALGALRSDRMRRALTMVERLNEIGYPITAEEVFEQAGGAVIGRPHVARVLVARGYVLSVRDAFTPEFIADGGRADVAKKALTPIEAITLVRETGGVPVIAHPGVGHHEGPVQAVPVELLSELRDAGLAGMEVDHPDHPPVVRDRLRSIASELGLVATGGSDYHGDVGQVIAHSTTSDESFAALEAMAAG